MKRMTPICISACNGCKVEKLTFTNRGCYGAYIPFVLVKLLVFEQRSCNLLTTAITMIKNRNISYQLPERSQFFLHNVVGDDNAGKCERSCHRLNCYNVCHEVMPCAAQIKKQVEESLLYWRA